MNKIKGFSWDGIDEKYTWVAQDENGDVYVYKDRPTVDKDYGLWNNSNSEFSCIDCKFLGTEYFEEDHLKDWQFKCFPREEPVENNPSEFSRENFEAYSDHLLTVGATETYNRVADVIIVFDQFLNSRKQIPQEIKEAIALLEKSGYKVEEEVV